MLGKGTGNVEIHAIDPSKRLPKLFIQVGAYDVEQNAKKLANKIEKLTKGKGHTIAVKQSKTKKGKKYHVHIGPIHDETVITELTNTIIRNKLPTPKQIKK
jgi:cell division septation protein DedD